jgi:protein-tyrosine kinase
MSRFGQAMSRSTQSGDAASVDEASTIDVVAAINSLETGDHDSSPWSFEPPAPFPAVAPVTRSRTTSAGNEAPIEPAPAVAPPSPITRVEIAELAGPEPDAEGPSGLLREPNPLVEERLVLAREAAPDVIEQYRRCAASLHQAQLDRGIAVVMVTSAALGEGKSLTSTNIALTLAESYRRRVLLIDADLRRPALHDIFQASSASGLSTGLRRERASTFTTIAITDKLALLPAGRPDPDPMASLTSARMRQLIDEARGKFDWVVIDTPPVALMPDASLLADMADGVVLVVQAGATPLDIIKQAARAIGKKRILGVVLNRAESDRISGYAGY